MSTPSTRAIVSLAYERLREKLAAKDVSAAALKATALEALERARRNLEEHPEWIAEELERLRTEAFKQADESR